MGCLRHGGVDKRGCIKAVLSCLTQALSLMSQVSLVMTSRNGIKDPLPSEEPCYQKWISLRGPVLCLTWLLRHWSQSQALRKESRQSSETEAVRLEKPLGREKVRHKSIGAPESDVIRENRERYVKTSRRSNLMRRKWQHNKIILAAKKRSKEGEATYIKSDWEMLKPLSTSGSSS